ncbi:MAG: hypothetical protein KBG80_02655 [Breznakibacter sp.]|nr:hypothetical protein [Breznakibacter sp.]
MMSEMADDNETIVIDNNTTSTSLSGFGDVIKLFTSLFGLDTCDKCEERRVKFNRKFAFVKAGKYISDEDVLFLHSVGHIIPKEQQVRIMDIYNYVYSDNLEVCYCAGLFKSIIDKLNIQIDRQRKD